MRNLKQILHYILWSILSFVLALGYMRVILGPNPESDSSFAPFYDWLYLHVILQIGAIVGGIIAFIYIFLDLILLRKKLKYRKRSILIRLMILIAITFSVGCLHYFLEKVVDVI